MSRQTSLSRAIGLILVLLILLACNAINPTLTSVPVPASTSIPFTPTVSGPTMPSVTAPPVQSSVTQQNPQRYKVEFVAVIKNDGFTLDTLQVYQPRPIAWDGQQDINVDLVSPAPAREGTDPTFGNGLYYWDVKSEKPGIGETLPIKIQFTYTAYEITANIDPDEVQPYDRNSPLYKLYTRPETFIESTDLQIVEIADQVAAGEENPYLLAEKFYNYVIETARYRLVGKGLLGAKALLVNGEGECGDYSSLFIALARAKGIPARSVVGYWAVSGVEQTHVWAEFYLERIGWVPVDPTIGQQSSANQEYYFGNMDNQRVILEKGFNIPMDPPTSDGFLAPLIQGPYFWFWGDGDGNKMSIKVTSWKVAQLSESAQNPQTYTVTVPAAELWFDTGIKITKGQKVRILASGIVNTWEGRDVSNSGADGQTTSPCDNEACPIMGAYYGELIGRLGGGTPFRVGAGLDFIATGSGTLFLTVNDWVFQDNKGEFQVVVTVE